VTPQILSPYFQHLELASGLRWHGKVVQVVGQLVESEGPFCTVGEECEIIDSRGRRWPGEIVGFRDSTILSMPLELPRGIRYGDRVVSWGERATLRVGDNLSRQRAYLRVDDLADFAHGAKWSLRFDQRTHILCDPPLPTQARASFKARQIWVERNSGTHGASTGRAAKRSIKPCSISCTSPMCPSSSASLMPSPYRPFASCSAPC